ncbi:hypothetical protein, partial [Salmonella enterica]
STDGQIHKTVKAAKIRDAECNIEKWVNDNRLGCGGSWSGDMIASSLIEGGAKLHMLFRNLEQARNLKD